MTEEPRKLNRRQFLQSSTIVAAALVAGAATGSTGPPGSGVGSGTTPKIPKWTNATTLGNSSLSDDGVNITALESIITGGGNTVNNPDLKLNDMSLFRIGPNELVVEANSPDPTWSALAILPLGGPGAPNGAPSSGISSIFVQDSNQANHNSLLMGFDHANSLFLIAQSRVGGSANYPVLFKSIGVESFRIETDQSVRYSIAPRPISDNTIDCATSALRWANLYALIMNSGGSNLTLTPNTAVVPGSDNAKDMGTAALRWRTEYLSNSLQVLAAASDANPTFKASASQLELGPGGASALDNKIARISATDLRISLNGVTVLDIAAGSIATVAQPFMRTNTGNGNFVINPGVVGGVAGHAFVAFDQGGGLIIGNTSLRPQAAGSTVIGGALGVGVNDSGVAGDGKFNGQLKSRGKNVLLLDGQSMTQSSHTVNNTDTDITTYSLAANSYTRVIVRVTGYVSFVTLSTNQSVNLKIKDGTTQVGNTMVVDGALSANASIPFTLEAAFVEASAVTLHFTEGAAAADANTTVFINSIVVLGES